VTGAYTKLICQTGEKFNNLLEAWEEGLAEEWEAEWSGRSWEAEWAA